MALFFATQGFGSVVLSVTANALRLLVSASGAVSTIYWLDLGATGFFIAVAFGFVLYAALTACAVLRAKGPAPASRDRDASSSAVERRPIPCVSLSHLYR